MIQNLVGNLATMNEDDIRRLFSPFGEIAMVDVPLNQVSRQNQGFAVVKFTMPQHATNAIKAMNGYVVDRVPIVVSQLTPYMTMGQMPSQLGEEQGFVQKYTAAVKPLEIVEKPTSKYALPVLDKAAPAILHRIVEAVAANRHYVDEPTRTVGFFNTFDFEDRKLVEDTRFVCELVDEFEGGLNSGVRQDRPHRKDPYGKARGVRALRAV